ncbi:FmdB family zinc ribbon protein [Mycolicibacterium baixiangningiae]|uniref:FmdB family zinc ribbon protein n=1 Tax=Mycolicibacterium baixiangningiae TaxID=2761578 RepID=UPI0018683BC3|nr:zinc ribbon domain-containing protein [Mycolicibacterium baixiangningiae]
MPTYSFHCSDCGPFDLTCPITDVVATPPCPACSTPARRVFASPPLTTFSAGQHRLADLASASAEQPAVTTTIPAALGRPRSTRRDPRLPALPRM